MIQQTISDQYEVALQRQILKVFHASKQRLHDNHLGSKKFTNYQRIALIVLFQRSRKALRDFVAELKESKWPSWLQLKDIPSYRTIHHWLTQRTVNWVRDVLRTSVAHKQPVLMAVDATGFDSWQRSRHYEKRIGAAPMPYAKADLLVDTEEKLIYDFVLRMKPRHDTLGAATMLKRCVHKNFLLLADKGYDSEPLHKLTLASGNILFAPVRKSPRKRPRGRERRRCSAGHEQYHQRNIVESINFSLKSRFRSLRAKKHYMKKREFAWKLVTYNLEKLSQGANSLLKFLLRRIILNRAQEKPFPFLS
ncbi:transposase [Candidatus Woesearchaeota archaeon]|nr:transposase [Candidatus Woesearchaeota archaeon]